MRLTLRTMLAYMDGILEPADAQVMEKKIEESEFAANLMHRIRDVSRRLRLTAPKLEGKGVGLDPNTVAEYLDNTLSSERVPDFEKVCLESDVHLAEVASSHQILALVLGEPAEIDQQARQRMYGIIDQADTTGELVPPPAPINAQTVPGEALAATAAATSPAAAAETDARRKPEVPEWLREGEQPKRSSGLLVACIALIVGLVVVGAAIAINRPDLIESLVAQRQTVEEEPVDPAPTDVVDPEAPAVAPAIVASPAVAPGEAVTPATTEPPPAETSVSDAAAETPTAPVVPPSADDLLQPESTPGASGTTEATTAMPPPPGAVEAPQPPVPGEVAPVGPAEPLPPMPSTANTATATTSADPAPAATDSAATPPEPGVEEAPATAAAPAQPVGRFTSDREVLMRFTADDKAWKRVPARDPIMAGDLIAAMPASTAQIPLPSGLMLEMLGGTQLQATLGADNVPGVNIVHGRLLVYTPGGANKSLRIAAGELQGIATLASPTSVLGVEVVRTRLPGDDPVTQPGAVVVNLYAHDGEIIWQDAAAAEGQVIRAPGMLQLGRGQQPAEAAELPAWITNDVRKNSEKLAAPIVEQALVGDRAVNVVLRELLVGDRRREVRLLALDCLAELGDFSDVPNLLRDPEQARSWNEQLDIVALSLDDSPASAAAIAQTFTSRPGDDGQQVYRLLWGYSDEQLAAGADKTLVDNLQHSSLSVRVASVWLLERITGIASSDYNPADTEVRRQAAVARWKQRLDMGQIRHK